MKLKYFNINLSDCPSSGILLPKYLSIRKKDPKYFVSISNEACSQAKRRLVLSPPFFKELIKSVAIQSSLSLFNILLETLSLVSL